jgi:KUP system potassium uptake protein
MTKLFQGGWVPLLLGGLIFYVMLVWQKGTAAVHELVDEMHLPVDQLVTQIASGDVQRVPGTGAFVPRLTWDVPPILFWYLRHIRSLHDSTVILNVATALVPYVAAKDRMESREIAPRVWRAQARFGFMEQPNLSEVLQHAQARGYPIDPSNATYFIGHVTIVPREDGKGLSRLVRSTYWFLLRNSIDASDYFRLPRDMVVEIGVNLLSDFGGHHMSPAIVLRLCRRSSEISRRSIFRLPRIESMLKEPFAPPFGAPAHLGSGRPTSPAQREPCIAV